MKKICTILVFTMAVFSLHSQVFSEYFEGAVVGEPLEGYNEWAVTPKSGDDFGVSPFIGETPLVYGGYQGSEIGHVAILDHEIGNDDNTHRISTKRVFLNDEPLRITAGEKIYVAFLVRISEESKKNAWRDFFTFEGSATSSMTRGRIFARISDSNELYFGIGKNSNPPNPTEETLKWDIAQTQLLVMVYEGVEGDNNDIISLYVNPDLSKDESEQTVKIVAADTQSDYSGTANLGINLRQRNIGAQIGGIRIAKTWGEVLGAQSEAPAISAPVVGQASDVGAETFVANWSPVVDAVGYSVKVYKGEESVGTYHVNGQSTSELFVKGLLTNTTYTYTVIAKGDGATYSDSDESAASAEFTTLEGLDAIHTDFSDGTWGVLYDSGNQPAAGAFPSSFVNGFDLSNTFLYDISRTDSRGELHQNGLRMDRQSNGGMVVLPTVKSLEQIEIHAIPGGAPRSINLKELVDGVWTTIGTYEMTSSTEYKEFIIPLSRTEPTKLRIENAGTGQVTLYQIITRTTNPELLPAPAVSDATDITSTGFAANWAVVDNATGYRVRVYQGTGLVETVDVPGQAVNSVNITGLEPELEYTYKVLALGDGFVNYADSYLSDASLPFVTSPATSIEDANANSYLYAVNRTIYSSERGVVEIYNLQGQKVLQALIDSRLEVDMPAGIYIVTLLTEGGKVNTFKMAVK